jgi:predicted ATP-grasp superfamily ATP-dependent carboligase
LTIIIKSDLNDIVSLSVARSLGKKNINFTIFSENIESFVHFSKYCKNSVVSQHEMEFFSKLSTEDVVYPMNEPTMLQLSKNKNNLSCSLAFSDYSTLNTVINKTQLMRHAIENNIPCPKTVFIEHPDDIKNLRDIPEFPIVLKPNVGSGGKGITFVNSIQDFNKIGFNFFKQNGPFVLQEKIPFNLKYTVGVICNSDSEIRRACVIKEIRNYPIETGPACYAETVIFPELLNICIKLMNSLNYFGVADIDFLVDSRTGKPSLMEINPRFWGSLQVAINAGVDFPSLLFDLMKNGDIEKSFTYKPGIRCRHLIFNDTRRLLSILKGPYESLYKVKSVADFLTFHPDDGYYIFSLDDLEPFRYALRTYLRKKINNHISF